MNERFYLNQELFLNAKVFLDDSEQHHLSNVMRIREGETVEIINGRGACARAKVEKTGLLILEVKQYPTEKEILLGVPFLRPSKLELIFEKGTEIGVTSFFLYPADKSTIKTFSNRQIQRFNTLVISALKQSGRLYIPHLEILLSLKEVLAKEANTFFGDIRKTAPFIAPWGKRPLFISGPESGFSKEEITLLEKAATGVQLNPNILRAETAPLVASSLIALNAHL